MDLYYKRQYRKCVFFCKYILFVCVFFSLRWNTNTNPRDTIGQLLTLVNGFVRLHYLWKDTFYQRKYINTVRVLGEESQCDFKIQ